MIGSQDLLVGLAIALFFFGAKRLPEIANSLGRSMKEFQRAVSGETFQAPKTETSPPRTCASCDAALEAEWTHCPRCGHPVAATVEPCRSPVVEGDRRLAGGQASPGQPSETPRGV